MTNSKTDNDELRTLQREVAELGSGHEAKPKKKRKPRTAVKTSVADDAGANEASASAGDTTTTNFSRDLDDTVRMLEEAARENPGLALLAAFAIGIAVGQLLTPR